MGTQASRYAMLALILAGVFTYTGSEGATLVRSTVFEGFTSHIQQQVELDKAVFVDASTCIRWFYKQEREKPPEPAVRGISDNLRGEGHFALAGILDPSTDCRTRYPGGLKAAREAFSQTQSTLSLSLTFYEFALVGDRDDDGRYNPVELKDILESFSLPSGPELSSAHQLFRLKTQFDSIHQTGQFDMLMSGMGTLYEKGYRFTGRDNVALNRIMG